MWINGIFIFYTSLIFTCVGDRKFTLNTTLLKQGVKLLDIVLRPQINLSDLIEHIQPLKDICDNIPNRKEEVIEAAQILLKYEGYIEREKGIAEKIQRLEHIKIKGRLNYEDVKSISTEAKQKLIKIDPETIGQASRIPGISPSDINILLVLLGR